MDNFSQQPKRKDKMNKTIDTILILAAIGLLVMFFVIGKTRDTCKLVHWEDNTVSCVFEVSK